ncbi:multidrug efflux RND transporter permease subunit [Pleomorphomonas koreensis]|uniref:multidrug efflux RND transporter permease subunit n=1 Tax=Pleomorphomonas koreensis TaxID=257440 RepID=UPI0004153244|nr:multidrug efflux RND transporter permease subunit [Pleomorphomonas koreensis]
MPQFFIDRPVFAWVIAIFISLAGIIAVPQLPMARFPPIAPPSVSILTSYTGASPQTISDSVIAPIERELSGVKNVLYFDSSADTSGSANVNVVFKPGTDPTLAQVDVQNRLKGVEAQLPETVRRSGLSVEAASSGFLMIVTLSSSDAAQDPLSLDSYLVRNIVPELRRVAGVGQVQSFGTEAAMRIWLDPARLVAYSLSVADVTGAIQAQNVQVAPGRLGQEPAVPGQTVNVPLSVRGQLKTPEEFAAIILRSNQDGSKLRLGDVARVEIASQSSGFLVLDNGRTATAAAIQLASGANAVSTSDAVRARMAELRASMPRGMNYSIAFDNAPFIKLSIHKVVATLFEAMALVFLIMLLFLQNLRYTIIPTIVAPVALLGTAAVMLAIGYSMNTLTMFGLVLAIGIIVDDAIVVVENVERIMRTENLPAREATRKAMREITGAIIGITLVLTAVFIPMAFASGSVGAIYRQFTVSMAVSILFSAFLALTLTPALCATLLRAEDANHDKRNRFFAAFNRGFEALTGRYTGWIRRLLRRGGRVMAVYAGLLVVLAWGFSTLPSAFVPQEDQGSFMTSFTLPADATLARTRDVVALYDQHLAKRPDVSGNLTITGFSFNGSGPNAALSFTTMKDWETRSTTVDDEIAAASQAMAAAPEGEIFSMNPPAIDELGTSAGFTLQLQDRFGRGTAALLQAAQKLVALSSGSKLVTDVRPDGLPSGPNVTLVIDRDKAEALSVPFATISDTLGAIMGSAYVGDFPQADRLLQVIVQADAPARMQVDDVLRLHVRNTAGDMVPLSEIVRPEWSSEPLQLARFNGYPSLSISGSAPPGVSSGSAMREIERLAGQLPEGYSIAWTGQSLQEQQAGTQAPMLVALSFLVVFLVLAALYESWTVPFAVMLVVPLGVLGAVAAMHLRGLENDVFFKVGLITLIGLSAKNAVLIVEFARQLHAGGQSLHDAIANASRLRLRPIVMTSLAFTLGVVPLVIASGANSATQHAIGTGLFGGMISATVLAVLLVPVFHSVTVASVETWRRRRGTGRSASHRGSLHDREA